MTGSTKLARLAKLRRIETQRAADRQQTVDRQLRQTQDLEHRLTTLIDDYGHVTGQVSAHALCASSAQRDRLVKNRLVTREHAARLEHMLGAARREALNAERRERVLGELIDDKQSAEQRERERKIDLARIGKRRPS